MEMSVKEKLSSLLSALSWADLSRTYFGQSNSWLYHKLNGIDGNGKPTQFSEEELQTLKNALLDLSSKLTRTAESL